MTIDQPPLDDAGNAALPQCSYGPTPPPGQGTWNTAVFMYTLGGYWALQTPMVVLNI